MTIKGITFPGFGISSHYKKAIGTNHTTNNSGVKTMATFNDTALVLVGLLSGKCAIRQIIKGLKHGKLAARLIDWDPASDWETPLSEVREKLGIIPLID
jgi:hypothetical protein